MTDDRAVSDCFFYVKCHLKRETSLSEGFQFYQYFIFIFFTLFILHSCICKRERGRLTQASGRTVRYVNIWTGKHALLG